MAAPPTSRLDLRNRQHPPRPSFPPAIAGTLGAAAAALFPPAAPAQGLDLCPEHAGAPHVVTGTASCIHGPSGTTIDLTSKTGVIHWDSFSVPAGTTTRFNFASPGRGAVVLNRVTGPAPSVIAGTLASNGSVVLINPQAGITVAPGATVTTAGFFASTLDLSAGPAGDAAFVDGAGATFVNRSGRPVAPPVLVQGDVRATSGDVVLLGGSVDIGGSVTATAGSARIGAGDAITFSPGRDESLGAPPPGSGFVVNRGTVSGRDVEIVAGLEITNAGLLEATGPGGDTLGRVYLRVGEGNQVIDENGTITGLRFVNGEVVPGTPLGPTEGDSPTATTPAVRRFPALTSPGSNSSTSPVVAFTNRAIAAVANSTTPTGTTTPATRGEKTANQVATATTRGNTGPQATPTKKPKLWARASAFFGLRTASGAANPPAKKPAPAKKQ